MTESKTFSSFSSWRLERRWASQAMEFDLPFQNLFPQIGSLITSGVIRIARASCTALVKRKEMRVPPRNAGGHVNLIRIYDEMDERPLPELEDQVRRVTGILVLIDRVPPCLSGHGVFKLGP